MHILPVSAFNIRSTKSEQKDITFVSKVLPQNDVFIKSPSFTSVKAFAEAYLPIKHTIKREYLSGKQINLVKLESLLKKYFPNLQVKNLMESNAQLQTSNYGAYFQNQVAFTKNLGVQELSQTIFFRMPEDSIDVSRLNFFANFLHEITHVLQENSSDRISRAEWIKSLIQKNPDKMQVVDDMVLAPKVFAALEQCMIMPLREFLMKSDNLPRPIKCPINESTINAIYKQQTSASFNDYVDYATSEVLKNVGVFPASSIIKRIISYCGFIAKDEVEAYRNGTDFLKEVMMIRGNTDLDLRVKAYEMFVKRMGYLANK